MKKIIVLILALVLCCGMAVGCADNKEASVEEKKRTPSFWPILRARKNCFP